jgi:tRNA uridine 5-carbamoylmethylation protein Kti12
MSSSEKPDSADNRLQQLEAKLQQLTEEFDQQMRARGFDPQQAENVALPSSLAHLYAERQSLIEELEEIRRDK